MRTQLEIILVILLLGQTTKFTCLAMDDETDRVLSAGIIPLGQITFCIVDSFGKPVNKAEVGLVFWQYGKSPIQKTGYSNAKGLFCASVKTPYDMDYVLSKGGYYETRGRYRFIDAPNATVKNKRWLPWNPTITNTLREIRRPIPILAKGCYIVMPVREIPVGFDFMKGDLVHPYGSGTNADVYFTLTGKIPKYSHDTTIFPSDAILECSNRWDGFVLATNAVGSVFLSGYEAPTNGYQNRVVWHYDTNNSTKPFMPELGDNTHYIFRVRTVRNERGDVVGGCYGRMHRPMEFGNGKERNEIKFVYYFNPTSNDRNLESNPSQNLFGNDYRLGSP